MSLAKSLPLDDSAPVAEAIPVADASPVVDASPTVDGSDAARRAVAVEDRYPTPDEVVRAAELLAERHPELCRLRQVGRSRAGRPLLLLSVGRAAPQALVVAGAHANESVGGATVLELARRVVADPGLRAGCTWNLLLCLDPDGASLASHGRTPGPYTLAGHYRDFFRPAGEEQPEWAPSLGADLPESRALLAVIDELRPFLQCSLHSTDVGGTFLQATRDQPGLDGHFARSAAGLGIPVELSPYDVYFWPNPNPGVFLMPEAADRGPEASSRELGRTTWHAPHRHGGSTLIVEVPLWTCGRLADPTPIGDPEAELTALAARMRRHGRLLAELLAQAERLGALTEGPLPRAVRSALDVCAPLADEWDPGVVLPDQPALPPMTRSRLATLELWAHRVPLRAASMLRRALDPQRPGTGPLRDRLEALADHWCEEYRQRFPGTWLPIARQVEHQAGTVAAAVLLARPGGGAR